jgi:hypothetical protein
MSKKFAAKDGEKPTEAPVATVVTPPTSDKKTEAPKLPVKSATKNDTLKCVIVNGDNGMTYFGTESRENKGLWLWRVRYSSPAQLFTKIDAIVADETLKPEVKDKKISDAFKSMTSPVKSVPFTHKLESSLPPAPTPGDNAPVASAP